MRVVLAPDSFKESMTAADAAAAMARGVRSVHPDSECVEVPMADGGEGTTAALMAALEGQWRTVRTADALGRRIEARYGLTADGLAVIFVQDAQVTRDVVLGAVAGRRRGLAADAFIRASRARDWSEAVD